ncbi:hypothetical protein HMPREF3201_02085 [Megasphaera sp. MJR8396C]|nr:hypothetical protein HMPREF3201_02085 [Megasphaera sp. MJR8396C]
MFPAPYEKRRFKKAPSLQEACGQASYHIGYTLFHYSIYHCVFSKTGHII